jgi:hypothetical protein
MALSRVWYTEGNYANPDISSAANSAKSLLWSIKALLTGDVSGSIQGNTGARPASSKWTVHGSCDAVTAAFDQVDRWGTSFNATKLVNANFGVAHSWITLKSPTGLNGGNTYLNLIYRDSGNGNFVVSFCNTGTGFASPSTTSDFTAPSDTVLINVSPFQFHDNTATQWRIHLCVDAVGRFYMAWGKSGNGLVSGFLGLVDCANLTTGDTRPLVGLYDYDSTFTRSVPRDDNNSSSGGVACGGHNYNNAENAGSDTANLLVYSLKGIRLSTNTMSSKLTTTSAIDSSVGAVKPTLIYSSTGSKYVKGTLPDAFITGTQVANGASDPLSGSMEHVQIGTWRLPFNAALSF